VPSLFTRIIDGDLPGRFVYEDPVVVAFLTIAPVRPGHTLVVPRVEIDDWLDLDPDTRDALFQAAQLVGRAVGLAFPARKVALLALGLEVPHVHLHLIPIDAEQEVNLAAADKNPHPAVLDDAAERIRAAVAAGGHPSGG
jgi:histidine triad (HIT) family protein